MTIGRKATSESAKKVPDENRSSIRQSSIVKLKFESQMETIDDRKPGLSFQTTLCAFV
jgi:hypothetical protein